MKIDITNQPKGVKATLTGFSTTELGAKIEACQNGQCGCDCDPEVMEKITGIELKEESGNTTLTVSGEVDAETLAPMMQSCLIGENK
jgi:hypothetical protein